MKEIASFQIGTDIIGQPQYMVIEESIHEILAQEPWRLIETEPSAGNVAKIAK